MWLIAFLYLPFFLIAYQNPPFLQQKPLPIQAIFMFDCCLNPPFQVQNPYINKQFLGLIAYLDHPFLLNKQAIFKGLIAS